MNDKQPASMFDSPRSLYLVSYHWVISCTSVLCTSNSLRECIQKLPD